MPRIFSKVALRFDMPGETPVVVKAKEFADVPDWVLGSQMFKLASQDGTVTVIESAQQASQVEQAANTKKQK
ncbi:MAG: hypothetical protein K6T83_01135 [Alicyclobacillus sp.]|nr:hypothetical protein [Alicyclobacillus sp.]